MFKLGDMVIIKGCKPDGGGYVITRVYDDKYVAIGNYDVLGCIIMDESKVEAKYLTLVDLNDDDTPGMSYGYLQKAFFEDGYFTKNEDGTVTFNDKKYPLDGDEPSYWDIEEVYKRINNLER